MHECVGLVRGVFWFVSESQSQKYDLDNAMTGMNYINYFGISVFWTFMLFIKAELQDP